MRKALIALALALAGCLSNASGTSSSGGSGGGGSTGGVGSAQLSGPLAFPVVSAWYGLAPLADGGLDRSQATLHLSAEAVPCGGILSGTRSVASLTLQNLTGQPIAPGSFTVTPYFSQATGQVAGVDSWRLILDDGGEFDASLALDAGSTFQVSSFDADGGMHGTFELALTAGLAPGPVNGTFTAAQCR